MISYTYNGISFIFSVATRTIDTILLDLEDLSLVIHDSGSLMREGNTFLYWCNPKTVIVYK
jgi:hypothetical protein